VGFSIGLGDCTPIPLPLPLLDESTSSDAFFQRVGLHVRANTRDDNAIATCISAGSKGNWINLVQMRGVVGQQYIDGEKVVPNRSGSGWSDEGFCFGNYHSGLAPLEFWSHLIAARDAICKTGTGTAVTGYLQRKLIKHCENQIVQYDGTVRAGKRILRFA
jgi:DNA-directed RNA polymerase II subunit RPB1